ncbi:hypothetical protein EPN81_00250 [Patescibacteria group bacterium]|nr:MAG: hypothetical protein EPN81_00250 [Patescibacteria group bacterium]
MGSREGREGSKGLKGLGGGGLVLVSVLFFVGSLVLVNPAQLYVSPDETANAFFATQFAQTLSLAGPDDELAGQFNRLHPRSTLVLDGQLVPGSFLGLPFLYGFFVMILGPMVLWIFTPLLTILAAYGWRQLVERYTTSTVANMAFAFFLLHPAVWYYSARGLMHNILFLDLLVLATWLWVVRPIGGKVAEVDRSVWNDLLSGLCVGLALFVRTSEFLWISIGLVLAGCIWWRSLSWRRVRAGLFGLAVGLGLFFLMNYLTYGHPLTTGYTLGTPSATELVVSESVDSVALLPFGFHPMNAWRHFSTYAVGMFWWLSMLALPGFFLLLSSSHHRRNVRWVIALATTVSLWLVLMYGSWEIHDNPDPTAITMANSYVRYWLPMYLFTTPMIAMTIQWIAARGRSRLARGFIVTTLFLGVLGLNINSVFVQGQDGLVKMREELSDSAQIQESVLRSTEDTSVIIVDRGDKLFFPHRHVWYPLRDEATYDAMPALSQATTLYYYGVTFPEEDFAYLNRSRLKRMDLGIELVETYGDESLYRINSP